MSCFITFYFRQTQKAHVQHLMKKDSIQNSLSTEFINVALNCLTRPQI